MNEKIWLSTEDGYILSEEQSEDLITAFSADAISKGCIAFFKKFYYISLQPARTGKGSDLKDWIVKLLRMRLTTFNLQQYCAFYSISSSSKIGGKHVNQMLKYNLIYANLIMNLLQLLLSIMLYLLLIAKLLFF